jgi:hypothetical protein
MAFISFLIFFSLNINVPKNIHTMTMHTTYTLKSQTPTHAVYKYLKHVTYILGRGWNLDFFVGGGQLQFHVIQSTR